MMFRMFLLSVFGVAFVSSMTSVVGRVVYDSR